MVFIIIIIVMIINQDKSRLHGWTKWNGRSTLQKSSVLLTDAVPWILASFIHAFPAEKQEVTSQHLQILWKISNCRHQLLQIAAFTYLLNAQFVHERSSIVPVMVSFGPRKQDFHQKVHQYRSPSHQPDILCTFLFAFQRSNTEKTSP